MKYMIRKGKAEGYHAGECDPMNLIYFDTATEAANYVTSIADSNEQIAMSAEVLSDIQAEAKGK